MPRAKSPSPGIGRPLTELRAVADRVEVKLDTQQQAIEALLHASTRLADAAVMMAQLLAHPPTRTGDVVQALREAGQLPTAMEMQREVSRTFAVDKLRQIQAQQTDGATDDGQLCDEYGEPQVPRGTAPDLDEGYSLSVMASELAEMAAEDDEPPPPPNEDEVWSRRLSTYWDSRLWFPGWGPRPGQPGCLAPPEMLNGGGR